MVMNRTIDPDTLAAISNRAGFYPVILVFLDWPSGPVRRHSNPGDITFGGETFEGVGEFGQISLPNEATGLASDDATVGLVGLGDDLDDYHEDAIRGRAGRIWFGAVTERSGNTLVGDPFQIFAGTMARMRDREVFIGGSSQRGVTITLSPGPSQRAFAAPYHSDEDQRIRFPLDTAGRLIRRNLEEAKRLR